MECLSNATVSCGSALTNQLVASVITSLLTAQCSVGTRYPRDRASDHLPSYDFVVVGAGSAGSSLAARLSDNAAWNVLLVEAGPDPPTNEAVPALMNTLQKSEYDWQYKTERQQFATKCFRDGRSAWARGKLLGGSSGINAMIYQMGHQEDYDEWAAAGCDGWGWADVKKYFAQQFEQMEPESFEKREEGQASGELRKLRERMLRAARELGFDEETDDWRKSQAPIGYVRSLATIRDGARNSAARVFLSPLADRENLHVIKNGHVGKVIINPTTKVVEGIEVLIKDKWTVINTNKEVILSAGAINTPQLLMLSGVGPSDHLESLGIHVISDVPVGRNLQDHSNNIVVHALDTSMEVTPSLLTDAVFNYFTNKQGLLTNHGLGNLMGFLNSENGTAHPADLQIIFLAFPKNAGMLLSLLLDASNLNAEVCDRITKLNANRTIVMNFVIALKPASTGFLQLRSVDPLEAPLMDPQYNTEPADMRTLLAGMRHVQRLMQTEALRSAKPEFVRFDLPACDGHDVHSDEYGLCYVKHFTSTIYHPVGTAKMGAKSDADTVVDSRLRVRGVHGLRVADGSIMPSIVRGNTNAPIIMIGQKAAELIQQDWEENTHSEL